MKTHPSYEFEEKHSDAECIAGVDEAGRGAWAGDIFVGVFVLNKQYRESKEYLPLNDSKKLSAAKRQELFDLLDTIGKYSVGRCSSDEIDRWGLTKATTTALEKALANLPQMPDLLLLDAGISKINPIPCYSIVKGDSKSYSIAAASIAAKVSRDRYMKSVSRDYPQWSFEIHMGYGTKIHAEKIAEHGISPIHRKSFKPIFQAANLKVNDVL